MVAPAALTLGSPCATGPAGLAPIHGDRPCFPKLPSLHPQSNCFTRTIGGLRLAFNSPPRPLTSLSAPASTIAVDPDQVGSSPPSDEVRIPFPGPLPLTTDISGFCFSPRKCCIIQTRFEAGNFKTHKDLGILQQFRRAGKLRRYYFVVANAKFMLDEEEHFQEQLSERLRNFGERNREQDFWLVIEPKFLDKFPNITKRLKRPAVALVSTDATWITFMKLRLDRVLTESFEADNLQEALASNPVDLKFEKPEKWTAPYPKYEYGWWERFLPPGSSKTDA